MRWGGKSRLFLAAYALQSGEPVTADQLASSLGVSVRTVYRYYDRLRSLGYPLRAQSGFGAVVLKPPEPELMQELLSKAEEEGFELLPED